jgi:hypothetical protein
VALGSDISITSISNLQNQSSRFLTQLSCPEPPPPPPPYLTKKQKKTPLSSKKQKEFLMTSFSIDGMEIIKKQ